MKNKFLSLILCVAMLFTLIPVFTVPGEAVETQYVKAEKPSGGWTLTDIRNWQSSDENACGNDLYYKENNTYYKVYVVEDRDYYTMINPGPTAVNIRGNFSNHKPNSTGPNYAIWGQTSEYNDSTTTPIYWVDDDTFAIHQLYYNVYRNSSSWGTSYYYLDVFYYTDTTSPTGSEVNSSDTRATALSSGTIRLLKNSGQTSGSANDVWYYGWATGNADVSGKQKTITGHELFTKTGTASAGTKYAAYIVREDGSRDYLSRSFTERTYNTFDSTGNVDLYYLRNRTPDESAGESWIYTPVAKGWKTSSDYGTEQLYAYVDKDGDGIKEHVAVNPVAGDLFTEISKTGGWTAEEVHTASVNRTQNGRDGTIYYQKAAGKIASPKTVSYYKYAGDTISATEFVGGTSLDNLGYVTNNTNLSSFNGKFYYNSSDGKTTTTRPFWHQVYENTTGVVQTGGIGKSGYIVDLWYYTQVESSDEIEQEQHQFYEGTHYSNQWTTALSNGTIARVPHVYTDSDHTVGNGVYEAYYRTDPFSSHENYTGKLLYTKEPNNSVYNELQDEDGNALAWALAQEDSNSATIPGSSTYDGTLYYHDDGVVKLVYEDGTTLLPSSRESNIYDEVIYPGTLYTRSVGVMGELDGEKKLSSRNEDGTFDLTIDSWATGQYQGYEEEEDSSSEPAAKTPLDIVIAVDQSGSMRTADLAGDSVLNYTYKGDEWTVEQLRNGTQYYYYDSAADKYYPVQLGRGSLYSTSKTVRGNETFGWGNDGISVLVNGAPTYYNVRTHYYVYVDADGDGKPEMHRLRAITAGLDLHYGFYPYIYKDEDNEYAQMGKWTDNHYWFRLISPWGANKLRLNSKWNKIVAGGNDDDKALISFIDANGNLLGATDSACNSAKMNYSWITNTAYMTGLYTVNSRGYADLYYINDAGEKVSISKRYFSDDDFTDAPLYTVSGGTKRVTALESAVNKFVAAVKADAEEEGNTVDHQIAIVGYAQNQNAAISPAASDAKVLGSNGLSSYTNTGLFTGNDFGSFTNYNNSPAYGSAFVKATDVSTDFTDTFGTWGGTYPSYGMDMAKEILSKGRSDAKKVVIVFTDGEPGEDGYQESAAGEALISSESVKNIDGVEVYTVGLYPQSASNDALTFLKQLSSEYTTTTNEVIVSKMDPDKTYFVKKDGQYVGISTDYYGESSLGWWEDLGNGEYRLMNVKGANAGAGDEYLYDGSTQVAGENADTSKTYKSENGNNARYEYHWFDADMNFADPSGKVYSITNVRKSGEYSMTTSSKNGLEAIFTDLANDIQEEVQSETPVEVSGGGAVNYDSSNSIIRDVISSDFNLPTQPTVKLELVPATVVDGDVQATGASATDVTNDPAYSYEWDGKSIIVKGFDFGANGIYNGHNGNILRVTITGLEPANSGLLFSNVESKSGIYAWDSTDGVGDRLCPYNNPSTNNSFTVKWIVDGETVETDEDLPYNSKPSYDGEIPSKPDETAGDEVTSYIFTGWANSEDATEGVPADQLPAVTDDADYYAVFESKTITVRNEYTVKWHDTDTTNVLITENGVQKGTNPKFTGTEPTKDSYLFLGWSTDENAIIEIDANGNIVESSIPANFFEQQGGLPVEYYDTGSDGVIDFYPVFVAQGSLTIENKTIVTNYSVKHKLASEVYDLFVENNPSGVFALEGVTKDSNGSINPGTAYFTPNSLEKSKSGDNTYDLTPMGKVNTATYYTGASADDTLKQRTATNVTVIPGSSVYLDDSIVKVTASKKDGSNDYDYAAALVDADEMDNDADHVSGVQFKFKGSRIDVYCTTDENAGQVIASFYKIGSDGTPATKAEKVLIMKNATTNLPKLYNVPTVSYSPADPSSSYLLKITAMKNTDYRLDGVRVYQPGENIDNTTTINVRNQLLNGYNADEDKDKEQAFSWDSLVDDSTKWGALYIDSVGNASDLKSAYKDYGPKNEVYLSQGQGIAFNISGYNAGDTVMIGLSAPKGEAGIVKASGKAEGFSVNSVVDIYYPITPMDNGDVYIYNDSDTIISVTNVEIHPNATQSLTAAPKLRMTRSLKSYVENFSTVEEERVLEDSTTEDNGTENQNTGESEDTQNPDQSENTDPNVNEDNNPSSGETPTVDEGSGNNSDTGKTNSVVETVKKTIQSITKTIRSLFKSIFRR